MSRRQGCNWIQSDRSNRWSHLLSTWWIILIFLSFMTLFVGFAFVYLMLPTPLFIKDEASYTDRFIGERAQNELKILTDIGQKVAGSVENEEVTVGYIVKFFRNMVFFKEVERINLKRNPIHKIEIDVQKASGGFFLDLSPYGMTAVYEGLQNVVIKFGPADREPEHSIMINTHFDTVPVSPGAGDAGIMVVVMLEILRVLSRSSNTLEHSIIFLLNGAEENLLQGSHAFITQHKWAKNVSTIKKSSSHPLCSALGEELFQANLVPSDTDFRIFRDFGKIPGMDFAHSTNGYVYHTKYDRFDIIPAGTYQHTGDNMLALIKELGNAPEVKNIEEHSEGKVIFYDLLGKFMIYYTETQAIILNGCVAVAFFIVLGLSLISMSKYSKLETIKEILIAFIVQLMSTFLGIALVVIVAIMYDAVGRPLSWFSIPQLIFGIYFCPLFFGLAIGPVLFLKYRKKTIFTINHHVQLFMHAQCLIYVILLITLTILRIRSAFVVLMPVLFHTIIIFINWITTFQNRGKFFRYSWIYVHCLGQIVPLMFFSELTMFSFQTFIPMQGRSGPASNPEIMIAAFSIFYGLFMGGFLMPLVNLARKPLLLTSLFAICAGLTMCLVSTSVGFPYREATSPQRFWVFHTERKLHGVDGSVRHSDSGYFMLDMDRNSPHYVKDDVKNITNAYNIQQECQNELFCGMPFYTARMHKQSNYSHYILAPKPYLNQIAELQLTGTEEMSSSIRRYKFTMRGPDHMGLFISPVNDVKLVKWSILEDLEVPKSGPKWQNRDTHFIYYFSTNTSQEFNFYLDFEAYGQWPEYVIDLTQTGHFMHYDEEKTKEFVEFIESFPKWTHVTAWMTSVESWKF